MRVRRSIFRPQTLSGACHFLLGCAMVLAVPPFYAQPPDVADSGIVTGHPFSAAKFTRTVHVESDGTLTILTERRDIQLARNADGRVFIADGTGAPNNPCNLQEPNRPEPIKLPQGRLPPLCVHWSLVLFDPTAGIIWHWLDGEHVDHAQLIEIDLLSDQTTDAKRSTSAIPVIHIDEPEPTITMHDLGEQIIEGIPARGVQTITLHKDVAGIPKVTIHEVWISTQMSLVLKVIDGDPAGDETVTGLDLISLAPNPKLLQPPPERLLRHYKDGKYTDDDFRLLANWLVR